MTEFAKTAYLWDFVDPHARGANSWQSRLVDYGNDPSVGVNSPKYTGGDAAGDARPARTLVAIDEGDSLAGDLAIEPGGMRFLTLLAPADGVGEIDLTLQSNDSSIVGFAHFVGSYPATCRQSEEIWFEDGVWTGSFSVGDDGCTQQVVIALNHDDPDQRLYCTPATLIKCALWAPTVTWTANYAEGIISNGTIALGINREGHLNAPGDVPSPVTGTTHVGLRYVGAVDPAERYEGTSHACLCEGWGVADATSRISGSVDGRDVAENLEILDYTSLGDVAVSRVLAAGALEVKHVYRPHPETPFLYEVLVTVENQADDPVDLRYRRTIDWDVEPTTFREWVTVQTLGGGPAPGVLRYTSNNGFASPDPLSGPTDLGQTGLFTDYGTPGPDTSRLDHGALFDFSFGTLNPRETKTFYLYWGATRNSEGAALTALSEVGAEVYSFGQPGTAAGKLGDPITFIFGFKDGPVD